MLCIMLKCHLGSNEQFEPYQLMCETVKEIYEAGISKTFPCEERIFWPYKAVQFYIREGEEKIQVTGN